MEILSGDTVDHWLNTFQSHANPKWQVNRYILILILKHLLTVTLQGLKHDFEHCKVAIYLFFTLVWKVGVLTRHQHFILSVTLRFKLQEWQIILMRKSVYGSFLEISMCVRKLYLNNKSRNLCLSKAHKIAVYSGKPHLLAQWVLIERVRQSRYLRQK